MFRIIVGVLACLIVTGCVPAPRPEPAPFPLTATVASIRLGTGTPEGAIALLRARLSDRGLAASALAGPIGASQYDPALILPVDDRAQDTIEWLDQAWLVGTSVGTWWVWDYGATAPADRAAATIERNLRVWTGEE